MGTDLEVETYSFSAVSKDSGVMKPQVGKAYIYSCFAGITTFRCIDFNEATGCIYLVAECPHEKAVETLTIKVKDKYGKPVETTSFVWLTKEKCWAVNAAWEPWTQNCFGPLLEDPMTELTRLTEAMGGYVREFKK